MDLRFLFTFLIFPFFAVSAEVGKFLEPISVTGQGEAKARHYIKSSALVAPVANFGRNSMEGSSSGALELDRDLLEQKLGELLGHRYQASGKVGVFLTREWNVKKVSPNFIIKIHDCMPDELSSSTFVRFGIWDHGSLIGNFAEPIRLAHYVEVFFSNKQINRGSRLNPSMFVSRPVDVLKQYSGAVPASSKLSGYQLAANVRENSAIRWNHLSKVTLVQKGKIVDVFAAGNGIYVTMKGMALEDGVEGGSVKIKNLSSDKIFHAKVLNENSVKVHL